MAQLLAIKRNQGIHTRGDIIEARASGTPFDGAETAYYVMVDAPDANLADFEDFNRSWETLISYNIVGSDTVNDIFNVVLVAQASAVSGKGGITRQQVEAFINRWGGTVQSFSANTCRFQIDIFNAIKSQGFWEVNTSGATWNRTNLANGVHTIQLDFSALGNNPTYIERFVRGKGATIISNVDKVITFTMKRSVVRQAFEDDIKEKSKKRIARRRFYFGAGVMNAIESAGGTVTSTKATVLSYIKDKLDD